MDFIEPIMKWIVAPMAAAIGWVYKDVQDVKKKYNDVNMENRILEARLNAQLDIMRNNNDALTSTMGQVLKRLDSIDIYLRGDNKNES